MCIRDSGFTQGIAALRGADPARLIEMGPHTAQSVHAALVRFRSERQPATALVTGNNRITVLVLRALAAMRGWHPALVGFDDLELADLLRPSLTVIEQDASALGKIAAELLFLSLIHISEPTRLLSISYAVFCL